VVDLATANGPSNNVSILLGKGDGTFKPAVNYSTFPGASTLAVGDFNGDGKPDLVAATNGTLSILIGNGEGTFKASVQLGLSGTPGVVAVADLTGKGRSDIAVTTPKDQLAVLLSNGDGTFKPAVNYTVPTGLTAVAVGDFNGDGVPDLVAVDNPTGMSVLPGNGDGTFGAPVSYAAGPQPYFAVVADFNGDARSDVAVVNFNPTDVDVLLGAATTSDLTLTKSHSGDFMQGQTGAVYTIAVNNLGPATTAGTVTVTDTLPQFETASAMAGTGWTCVLSTTTCTRFDPLPSGGTYPPITLTVNIDPAAPASLANTATVAGGADGNAANNTSVDTANVTAAAWSIVSGNLPDGLAMSAAGEISGTPTTDGDSMFVVGVTDANGATASQMFDLTVADPSSGSMGAMKRRQRH
jgi:uncharacterized repeat protein (TIGR01451 family)